MKGKTIKYILHDSKNEIFWKINFLYYFKKLSIIHLSKSYVLDNSVTFFDFATIPAPKLKNNGRKKYFG